jgi:hypothetical protein
MGRHSRGAADGTPPPAPELPARHPYAPRSAEDTGTWDRSTYRVVDVGLPPDAPVSFPLNGSHPGTQTAGPNRAPARPPEPAQRTALRSVPESSRPPESSRYGPTRADLAGLADLRYGATREPGAPRYGATRADLAEPRAGRRPEAARPAAPEPVRPEPGRPEPGRPEPVRTDFGRAEPVRTDFGRAEPVRGDFGRAEPVRGESVRGDFGRAEPVRGESRLGTLDPDRYTAPAERPAERHGATRADLAESVGATALAPRPDPEPRPDADEITDTGARRARSTFHLAPDTDQPEPYQEEPSLLLQWGIFVAQTLTGAVAGLGVWLGFYRLWSTYPFYAAPSVGAVSILMLVLARTLRRRHGHDLDLMTAIVTIGVATVLTVLPAAFTLQHLA